MKIFIKSILMSTMCSILFFECSSVGELGQQVAVLLINSTSEVRKVTFEKRKQNGELETPFYLEIIIDPKSKVKTIIDAATYKIKTWDEEGRFSGHVKDYGFELHDDASYEHPYYLDVSLDKKYAVTDLDFIYKDTSQIDFSDFDVFKIYDGKVPFEIARAVRYNDIIFLEDHIPHQMNEHKKLYCLYPVPSKLNTVKIHLYLEEQIRVHYEN
jgi:hypothetical protein